MSRKSLRTVASPPCRLTASKSWPACSRRNRETPRRMTVSCLMYGASTMQNVHLLLHTSVRWMLSAFIANGSLTFEIFLVVHLVAQLDHRRVLGGVDGGIHREELLQVLGSKLRQVPLVEAAQQQELYLGQHVVGERGVRVIEQFPGEVLIV